LKKLIRKIDDTGTVDRRSTLGSSPPRTVHAADKIDEFDDLVLSHNMRQISTELGDRFLVKQASH